MSKNTLTLDDIKEIQEKLRKWKDLGYKKACDMLNTLIQENLGHDLLIGSSIANTINCLSKKTIEDKDQDGLKMVELSKQLIANWKPILKSKPTNKISLSQNNTEVKKDNNQQIPLKSTKSVDPSIKPSERTKTLDTLISLLQKEQSEEDKVKIKKGIMQIEEKYYERYFAKFQDKLTLQVIDKTYSKELKNFSTSYILKHKQDIIQQIKDDKIELQAIVNEKHEIFYTDEEKKEIQKKLKQLEDSNNPHFYDNFRKNFYSKFEMEECKKCKKKQVIIEQQLQTRCADEPMTIFYRCQNCGTGWKQ